MSESDFEANLKEDLLAMNESHAIEADDVFTSGGFLPSSTPFNKRRRNPEIPSSPGSIMSPLFSNVQRTPMPSDLSVSTKKKPRIQLESDDEDEETSQAPRQNQLDYDYRALKNRFSSPVRQTIPSSPLGLSAPSSPIAPLDQVANRMESITENDEEDFFSRTRSILHRLNEQERDEVQDRDVLDRRTKELEYDLELPTKNIPPSTFLERNFTTVPDTNLFQRGQSSTGTFLYFPHKMQKLFSYSSDAPLLSNHISILLEQVKTDVRYEQAMQNHTVMDEPPTSVNQEKKLWVDKWKPVEYVDLVGEEQLNRNVLHWVKQWDYCVFKKEKKLVQQSKKFKNTDKLHRPEKRILLLSGPPGLGKTTLAQVVARHCGYNTFEINASDDRTAAIFKNKIMTAIESKDIRNNKPNLVVIDEIDGVSGTGGESTFINLLVQLVSGKAYTIQNKSIPI
jgi:flagellar biosynthesis GTPase FlhF